MKALVASLAAAVLLCLVASIGSALAQATWICAGPFPGCPDVKCVAGSGTCPAGGNEGMTYHAVSQQEVDVTNCAPTPSTGCENDTFQPYCIAFGYVSMGESGTCVDFLCTLNSDVLQCVQ
jgi:hypothetical protein